MKREKKLFHCSPKAHNNKGKAKSEVSGHVSVRPHGMDLVFENSYLRFIFNKVGDTL
jgi:hypothetical protein